MMRKSILNYALAVTVAATLVGCASNSGAHHHDHAAPVLAAHVQTAQKCRAGAFVDAANIINSVVEIAMALPANTLDRTLAELDTVLYTALQQAHTETHGVAGTLSFGYDQSYARGVARGVALAKSRGLSADVIALGNSVVAALEQNSAIPTPALKTQAKITR
jgi:hypothetical protein